MYEAWRTLSRGADWKIDYNNTNGIIFVVDSSDRDRVFDARDELLMLLKSDELRDAVLLVYANKQDMPNAMNLAELTDKLGLHELRHRDWYIQNACATRGEGLNEGMSTLVYSGLTTFCRLVVADEGIEKTFPVGVCFWFLVLEHNEMLHFSHNSAFTSRASLCSHTPM